MIYWQNHSPHTSEKLDKTTVGESRCNDDVWLLNATSLNVDQRQDEGGKSESRETERSWVGELATSRWLVETWLELSTESWESCRLASVDVCEWVSSIIIFALSCVTIGAVGTVGMVHWNDASMVN